MTAQLKANCRAPDAHVWEREGRGKEGELHSTSLPSVEKNSPTVEPSRSTLRYGRSTRSHPVSPRSSPLLKVCRNKQNKPNPTKVNQTEKKKKPKVLAEQHRSGDILLLLDSMVIVGDARLGGVVPCRLCWSCRQNDGDLIRQFAGGVAARMTSSSPRIWSWLMLFFVAWGSAEKNKHCKYTVLISSLQLLYHIAAQCFQCLICWRRLNIRWVVFPLPRWVLFQSPSY